MSEILNDDSPIELVPLSAIIIPEERQRQAAVADDALVDSIRKSGLLNPIIIRRIYADDKRPLNATKNAGTPMDGFMLVAGERRLDAYRQLKRGAIPARLFEKLKPENAALVELQENLARKQLTWQEEVSAVSLYHNLKQKNYAAWTAMATSNDIGRPDSYVSKCLTIAKVLKLDAEIAGCATMTAAYNLLTNRAQRAVAAASSRGLIATEAFSAALPIIGTAEENSTALLEGLGDSFDTLTIDAGPDIIERGLEAAKLLETAREQERATPTASDIIINCDFSEWVENYAGPAFEVLHVDFPYGKNYKGSNTRRTGKATSNPLYDDRPDVFFQLTRVLLENTQKLATPSAHCIFWFDMDHYQWTVDAFTAAGWKLVQPHPLIWTKGYQGVAADPKRRPRHCYETALLFSIGDRKIINLDKDHIDCPVGKDDEKLHINQKPQAMLRHFLNIIVDEHTSLLDPTCGSGSAISAALSLGCNRVLGLEIDTSNADIAKFVTAKGAK